MTRLFVVALASALMGPAALAQSGGMTRTGTDTPPGQQTNNRGNNSDGSVAGVADYLGVDTSACQEYLVPTHRDIVELRYLAETLPAGSLKREVAGRIDRMEEQTASALGSLCGVRNLDRSPPTQFADLDLTSVAGAAGKVFGNDIEVNDDGFAVKVAEAVIEAVGGGSRRERRRAQEADDRRMARQSGTAIDDNGVADIVASIKAAPFGEDKVAALESGVAGKTFTSAQVAELVKAMPFAEQRVPVALYLHDFATDPQNYETQVGAALPFASERSELRAALANR